MIHAVSGMRAAQVKMDSIGNNVANTHTFGYKSQEVSFRSFLADQAKVRVLSYIDQMGIPLTIFIAGR